MSAEKPTQMNLLQLGAISGANEFLLIIKEHFPHLFSIQEEDINLRPLMLAMVNSKNKVIPEDVERYKETIKFIAEEQYQNGRGIIEILSFAVQNKLILARDALIDIWATKCDALAAKTPLMWAMENIRNPAYQNLVSYISKLPQDTIDHMPELGKGLLTLDDDSLNMHYPQFALNLDPRIPGDVVREFQFVPNVYNRPISSEPIGGQACEQTFINYGKVVHIASQAVHVNRDKFNYACMTLKIELAQSISENPNLREFNDNTRRDHIHHAVNFANKEIVDNIASKEPETINNIDSFMSSPLDYAVDRWVDRCVLAREITDDSLISAQRELAVQEAKYIISTLCHHGARTEKACRDITNPIFLGVFLDIIANSEATYASWPPADDVVAVGTFEGID